MIKDCVFPFRSYLLSEHHNISHRRQKHSCHDCVFPLWPYLLSEHHNISHRRQKHSCHDCVFPLWSYLLSQHHNISHRRQKHSCHVLLNESLQQHRAFMYLYSDISLYYNKRTSPGVIRKQRESLLK